MSEFDTISCEHDGTTMDAFVARPDNSSGPLPAVIMFPGASGTGPTFEKVALSLAEMGYLAIGADVYGRGTDLSTPEAADIPFMAMLEQPEVLRARVVEWFEAVSALPEVDENRIAAIGYCFGGKCVLELARSGADLTAVVSYHGLLQTHAPAPKGSIKAEVVAFSAGKDPFAPIEDYHAFQKEMSDADVTHQITLFSDAQHSFTDPDHEGVAPGIAYHPMYHRISWASTLALLDFKLKG